MIVRKRAMLCIDVWLDWRLKIVNSSVTALDMVEIKTHYSKVSTDWWAQVSTLIFLNANIGLRICIIICQKSNCESLLCGKKFVSDSPGLVDFFGNFLRKLILPVCDFSTFVLLVNFMVCRKRPRQETWTAWICQETGPQTCIWKCIQKSDYYYIFGEWQSWSRDKSKSLARVQFWWACRGWNSSCKPYWRNACQWFRWRTKYTTRASGYK